jgi:hypothetical protein
MGQGPFLRSSQHDDIVQPWRRRQYVSSKRWYLLTTPHGVTTQNNNSDTLSVVRTSYLTELIAYSSIQVLSRLLWNQEAHCRVHNSPPLASVLTQINSIYTLRPCFLKMHFDIVLSSTPTASGWCLPFRISNRNFVHISPPPLSYTLHAPPISPSLIWSH